MSEIIGFFLSALMGFFAIMNPIGNTPIFLGLVEDFREPIRKRIARKSLLLAFIIVMIFTVSGNVIFKLFGITLAAFQLAGGILLFLIGYQLLHGRESGIHHPQSDEKEDKIQEADDISISPLAVPIFAGPGTITTALNALQGSTSVIHVGIVLLAFALICVASYFCFISGEKLVSWIKPGVIRMITRLMGLILTVISAQMLVAGIKGAFKL
jgi:multiple antibiotic resistance protein